MREQALKQYWASIGHAWLQPVRNPYRFKSTIFTWFLGHALEHVWNLTLEDFLDARERLDDAGGGGVLALCFLGGGVGAEFAVEVGFAGWGEGGVFGEEGGVVCVGCWFHPVAPDGAAGEDLPGELGIRFVGNDLGGGGPLAFRGVVVAGEGGANAVGGGVGGVGIVGIVPVRAVALGAPLAGAGDVT